MVLLAEETVITLIESSLGLMGDMVPALREDAGEPATAEHLRAYGELLKRLGEHRESDTRLSDDAWNWIWTSDTAAGMSSLQLYGRLSFINSELFHFL